MAPKIAPDLDPSDEQSYLANIHDYFAISLSNQWLNVYGYC